MSNGTVSLASLLAEVTEDQYTITTRAFELGYALGRHGIKLTTRQVAQMFCMSASGAYRLLSRASGSRRVPLIEDGGEWYVLGLEDSDEDEDESG